MSTMTTRRSVAKGALWATPIVMATSTIPAYSASNATCDEYVPAGDILIETNYAYNDPIPVHNGVVSIGFSTIPTGGSVTSIIIQAPGNLRFMDNGDPDWVFSDNNTTAQYVGAPITEAYNDSDASGFMTYLDLDMEGYDGALVERNDYPVLFNASCAGVIPLYVNSSTGERQ